MLMLFVIIVVLIILWLISKHEKTGGWWRPIAFDDWDEKDRIRKRKFIDKMYHRYPYYSSPTYFIPQPMSLQEKGFRCKKIKKDGNNIFVPTIYHNGNVKFSKLGYDNEMTYGECYDFIQYDDNHIKTCKRGSNDIECQGFFKII